MSCACFFTFLSLSTIQTQQQEAELKSAHQQVEESTKEQVWREQMEVENQKMRGELDKLPTLQKDLEQEQERVKSESTKVKKELEALPLLQKELELLKDQVIQLAGTDNHLLQGHIFKFICFVLV